MGCVPDAGVSACPERRLGDDYMSIAASDLPEGCVEGIVGRLGGVDGHWCAPLFT